MKKILNIMLCCLLLTACTEVPAETTLQTETSAPTTVQTEQTEETAPENTQHPLNIFVPNENVDDFETIPTVIDQLDAELVLSLLIEHGVLNEDIKLNGFELVDSRVNLDFNQAFLDQLMTYGTSGEHMMIGCVVNTFLNVYDAETVYITVNEEIMESGHVIYDFPMEYFE